MADKKLTGSITPETRAALDKARAGSSNGTSNSEDANDYQLTAQKAAKLLEDEKTIKKLKQDGVDFDERTKDLTEEEKKESENENKANTIEFINFDEFLKVKLVTGKIINSEKVEGADKLLKNTVEIGNETRTIVSGIAKYYKPEEIIGKTVVVVSNLPPRKLRGIESQGMLLCACNDDEDTLSLITTDREMNSGCEVC